MCLFVSQVCWSQPRALPCVDLCHRCVGASQEQYHVFICVTGVSQSAKSNTMCFFVLQVCQSQPRAIPCVYLCYGCVSVSLEQYHVSICVTGVSEPAESNTVRVFIGMEYECPRGHRFFCSAPDKVIKVLGNCSVKVRLLASLFRNVCVTVRVWLMGVCSRFCFPCITTSSAVCVCVCV